MKKDKIKKILILRFGALGDVIHSSATIDSLKKYNPDFSIHYVTFQSPYLLLKNNPNLEKVWTIENKTYNSLLKMAEELKKEKFDLFINLQPSIRTKVFSFFINAKKNLTYKKTFKLHAVKNFWITAQNYFKTLNLNDELNLFIPDEKLLKTSNYINTNQKTVCLNIGANNARQGRKWPIDSWKELAKYLIDNFNCEIVLTGSKEELKLANLLLDVSPNIKNLCGMFDILENTALLSKCNLVISGDTGPLHLATAVKTTVIGLYGSMPISRTGPYGKSCFSTCSKRDCVPCNRRKCKYTKGKNEITPCMIDIKPKTVIELIKKNNLL